MCAAGLWNILMVRNYNSDFAHVPILMILALTESK